MSKQQVKLSFDGSVRKVMMDVGSYALIQQSVSNVIGLPVGEFTVSYVDDDKDVISFPTNGVTKDEFDAFKTVQGPIRLIIERVVKANQTSTTVKDDVTAPSSTSVETAPSAPPAVEASASTSAAVEEQEEEPPKKEKSLCSLIGTILSNENIVHDVQNAIASKQVADIAALIGAALVAAGDDGEEEGCSFTSLVPILFTQAPVLLDILHQLSEKHPEIKELVETVKEQGCCSFAHPRMYRRFFKICKRGGFGCHNEEQGDDNAGHHHRRCHRQDDNTAKPIHYGVTCDGCSSNNELKEKSITEGHFAQHCGGFIAGNRCNSASVYNFDLCESCEASGLFQQTHGPFVKIQKRNHGGCRRRRGNPFDVFGFHTAAAAASSCDNTQDDDVEQIYAQSSASKPCFEQKKSKKEEFENIQKQGMELFSSIMKAVNESSQPKKENTEKDIDALAEKWKSKIELLQSLGFVEWKRYLPILEEENGDLERCIGRILALHDA